MSLPEVHLIGGTRAEAVRLAPLATAMRAAGRLTPALIAGGRHPALVTHALAVFDLAVDVTLITEPFPAMVQRLITLWTRRRPAAVIVQDDTTTGLAGALAAAWHRIPVVHLEAGARSGDLDAPFPDVANRRLVAQLAALHLAPTPLAAMNLLDEHIATDEVLITANPMVDATLAVAGRRSPYENAEVLAPHRPVVVATHRDESLDRILQVVERHAGRETIPPGQSNPPVMRTEDLVDFYAESWISGDRHTVRYLLAPDAEVEWNLGLAIDEEELVDTLNRIAIFADGVTVVSKSCGEDGAVLVYDCAAPFGTARMVEFLSVAGGRITGVRQIFDVVAIDRYFPGLVDDE